MLPKSTLYVPTVVPTVLSGLEQLMLTHIGYTVCS